MKKIVFIILFSITCVFTCLGCISNNMALACIGSVASALLGSLMSVFIDEIDTHGQGLYLWLQRIKYRNEEIRLSFSYLFKIEINGKYLLVKGDRLKNQYQPVGGVYKYFLEAKPKLEEFKFRPDIKMGNSDETDDLRIFIKGKYLLNYMDWFLSMKDREYDPTREFFEELVASEILSPDVFQKIEYRKIGVHNKGVKYSNYLSCNEYVYADIFEIKLSEDQKQCIINAVTKNPNSVCLATADEIKKECFNGIERNIGNNARWILGE